MSTAFDLAEWQRFCAGDVRAAARETDASAKVSERVWRGVCERGFLRLFHQLPEPDAPPAMDALATACASTFWRATISSALCGRMIAEMGSPALQARWISGLATGESLGAFAATERGSGSDPASYMTRLHRRGSRWELTGEKTRISNAPDAHVVAVLCPACDENGRDLGLALAVVDLCSAGITRTRHDSLGLRGMGWGALAFERVRLDDESVVLDATMARTLKTVEWGQAIQSVCAIGLARAALHEAESFVSERVSFGRPLSQNGVVREHLDTARREIDAAALLVRDVTEGKARATVVGERMLVAKIFSTEAAVRACQAALRVAGGWGYSTALELERLLRDAYGNIPAGLPNDRLRDLLVTSRLGVDPWKRWSRDGGVVGTSRE